MHSLLLRAEVRSRVVAGERLVDLCRELGLPRSTAARWLAAWTPTDASPPTICFRCAKRPPEPLELAAYTYLLGQYLGDGHLVSSARVPVLRIYACTDYPDIVDEVERTIFVLRRSQPGRVRRASVVRMVTVQSYWTHWPCLLPQNGPGAKHTRRIDLAPWQLDLVRSGQWPLIRGLIHSDGCRALNRIVRRSRSYGYPRYFFSNESADIIRIFTNALDAVGVRWRMCRPNLVSVARRDSVALLDRYVGAKA